MTPGFYQYEFLGKPLMMSVQNTDNCSEVLPCTYCVHDRDGDDGAGSGRVRLGDARGGAGAPESRDQA